MHGNALEMAQMASHNDTHQRSLSGQRGTDHFMPTLFRLVVTLAVLAGLAYGTMLALVTFVSPRQAELSVRVPLENLVPQK